MSNIIVKYIKSISLEPAIFLLALALGLINGAQINLDLVIWKICNIELNFTKEICDNLSLDENNDYEIEVQKRLQNFEMVLEWIRSVPSFVYTLFIGALSDKFGRKPLILLPLLGTLIDQALYFVNYKLIESLPLEFIYFISFNFFLGGYPMYYLGNLVVRFYLSI